MKEFLENLKQKNLEQYNRFTAHTEEWQQKQYTKIAKIRRLKLLKNEGKILTNTNLLELVS